MRGRWSSILALAALTAACSSASGTSTTEQRSSAEADDEAPLPRLGPPPLDLPDAPEGLGDDVAACARDYRAIATAPLPERAPAQSFDAWYAGPFQGWVDHYNAVRGRCDEVAAALPEDAPEAQVLLGTQSVMHERLGQETIPLEEHAQMFVMSRYWTLGAACTFARCAEGPLDDWAAWCRAHASRLPECPPVPPRPGPAVERD